MMVHDTNLVLVWFGFVFLMLLFKVPFTAQTLRTGMFHFARHMRLPHPKTLAGRHEIRGHSSTRI